jgi:dCTP diphosphatase
MTQDKVVTLQDLKDKIAEFTRERDWEQFHSPKNLAMALAVEVAELMELFQWKTDQESRAVHLDSESMRRVREEVADVTSFLLSFCNQLDIDLASAVKDKLDLNATNYPVARVRGRAEKYTSYFPWKQHDPE